MYGLESIIGNFLTTAASPAVGGFVGDLAEEGVKDLTDSKLLQQLSSTTAGALGGAALGAGLGAITGGKQGAMGGALSGAASGGFGGYNNDEVMQSLGLSGTANGSQLALSQGNPSDIGITPTNQQPALPHSTMPGQPQSNPVIAGAQMPKLGDTPLTTAEPRGQSSGNYIDFLKKNYEVLAPMFFGGSALTSNAQQNELDQKYKQGNILGDMLGQRRAHKFAQSVYGYADGGAVESHPMGNPNITLRIPQWYSDDVARSGGIAALQQGLDHGYSNGGYINTSPMPEDPYPQSQIARAQPYPAASPQRHEVIQDYDQGGLIEGNGDGMSDDIPANISGKEPVKVADGEYVVPSAYASKHTDKLKHMLTTVRAAAHAKKGKQVLQDAGKKAFIKALTGVKA